MADTFAAQNAASRATLEQVVAGLTEADLGKVTPYGWTVSALLVHIAFWDQRILALLRRWKEKGVDESPIDPDAINGALFPICHAVEPHAAIELCLSTARAVDSELDRIPVSLVAEIEASGNHFRFNRGLHRGDHLEDIRRILVG